MGAGVTGATGVFADGNSTVVTPAGASFTADDLISQQMAIPEAFQGACAWIMSKPTFLSLRKLKDQNGTYLLNPDIRTGFGWTILGQAMSLYLKMRLITLLLSVIFLGLYVKLAQNVEIQVFNELYATRHATGVVGYTEFDSRIIEDQKISVMELAGA